MSEELNKSPDPAQGSPRLQLAPLKRELRRMVTRSRGLVTGIDLSGTEVKIAQIEHKAGQDNINVLKTIPYPEPGDSTAMNDALAALKKLGLDSSQIVAVIPRTDVTLGEATLPSQDRSELRKMAPFAATKLVPHQLDELTVDVQIASPREDGGSETRLAIATEERVQGLVDRLAALGIEPDRIEVSTEAVRRALGKPDEGTSVACYIAPERLDVEIMTESGSRFSRGVETTHLNGNADALAKEIERSLEFGGRNLGISKIDRVEIVADAAATGNLSRRLPAEYPSGPAYGFYSRWADREPDELCGYAAAIGAALGGEEGFNLLPRALQNRQRNRARIREALTTALLIVALIGLGSGLTQRYIGSAEAYLARNKETLADLEPSVRKLSQLEGRAKAISSHLNTGTDALEVYTELFRAIPPQVTLYRFVYHAGRRSVTLNGQAPELTQVLDMVESLSKSNLFTEVDYRKATIQNTRGAKIVNFRVEFKVKKTS